MSTNPDIRLCRHPRGAELPMSHETPARNSAKLNSTSKLRVVRPVATQPLIRPEEVHVLELTRLRRHMRNDALCHRLALPR
jgi:hypothetical protein